MPRPKRDQSGPLLYTWNWAGGGYNSCWAKSKRDALKRAREIGIGTGSHVALTPVESTLRSVTVRQMVDIDASYRSMCD